MLPHVVRFSGDLDISRYPELRTALAAVPADSAPVLVDLAEMETVDSVCMSELLLAKRRWERDRRRVAVHVTSPNVNRTLAIADVLDVLNVYRSRSEALAWLEAGDV